jgi:MFS-type transporter involved in bile tolerance (Atg22 family)
MTVIQVRRIKTTALTAHSAIPGFVGPDLLGYLSTKTGSFTSGLAVLVYTALAGGLLIFCIPRRGRSTTKPSRS